MKRGAEMVRISVELVPRDKKGFERELLLLSKNYPEVKTVNIPDIEKYELSGIVASSIAKDRFESCIPHIRASTVERKRPLSFERILRTFGIEEVLVINGDNADSSPLEEPCDSLDLIKKFSVEMPEVKVYAGLDQYRSSIREEIEYAQRKIEAGAVGFFTQPFFDEEFLLEYMDRLDPENVFWGVSPVITDRSKRYWENVNKVKFPDCFECDLKWNKDFARRVIDNVQKHGGGVYLMPIKADLVEYLSGIVPGGPEDEK